MASALSTHALPAFVPQILRLDLPAGLVLLVSLIIGFLMVIVFRYTSDQKAIRIAKDQLKAHLLAVRLFQDQLPVVLKSYGRIVRATGRYMRLALKPLLVVVLPLTLLVVQLDRYLGWKPLSPQQSFLLKARTTNSEILDSIVLQLPPELATTAPAVHIPAENEVVWRLLASKDGSYDVSIDAAGQTWSKRVVVSSGIPRLSPVRLQGRFWERWMVSGEPALPTTSAIQAVEVNYPPRNIDFMGIEWNWIWMFFVVSLLAGFLFKTVLGIQI
jgi:hypothetical protein